MKVNINSKKLNNENRKQLLYLISRACYGDFEIEIEDGIAKNNIIINICYEGLNLEQTECFVIAIEDLYKSSYYIKEILHSKNALLFLKSRIIKK